jgi:hypothetical protein
MLRPLYYTLYECKIRSYSKKIKITVIDLGKVKTKITSGVFFNTNRPNIKFIGVVDMSNFEMEQDRIMQNFISYCVSVSNKANLDVSVFNIKNINVIKCERKDDLFLFIPSVFNHSQIAKILRSFNLQEGIHFINVCDGIQYREDYPTIGKQLHWEAVEKFRKINKDFWGNRIFLMSKYISNNTTSVLDLGCWGSELKKYIPQNIKYYGCDYVRRSQETIVCNLNQYEFPDVSFDSAFISGSLEYMENLDWYFDQICKAKKEIILSYSALEYFPFIDVRKKKSWVNHLTIFEIMQYMSKRGWVLNGSDFWGSRTIILNFLPNNHITRYYE